MGAGREVESAVKHADQGRSYRAGPVVVLNQAGLHREVIADVLGTAPEPEVGLVKDDEGCCGIKPGYLGAVLRVKILGCISY